jgi:hypothetical protein
VGQRAQTAREAFANGFQYALTKDSMQGGFLNEAQRVLEAYDVEAAMTGGIPTAVSTVGYALRSLLDETQRYFTGVGDPDLARKRATDFMKNGGGMASQAVHNAITLNEGAFGLEGPEREAAAAAATEVVSAATIMTGLDPRIRGTGDTQVLRQKIAAGIGKMRSFGMGDEQISALFDGLEGLSNNRAEILQTYAATGDQAQFNLVDSSLEGVGRIQDMIEGVLSDENLMKTAGGKLADYSKFDLAGVVRKSQLAYGAADSPEMVSLARDLQAMGLSAQEIQSLSARLIESDPRLQYLRPEEFAGMLQGLARQQSETAFGLETAAEDIGQLQSQVVAEGRLRGLEDADRRLAELAGLFGG